MPRDVVKGIDQLLRNVDFDGEYLLRFRVSLQSVESSRVIKYGVDVADVADKDW